MNYETGPARGGPTSRQRRCHASAFIAVAGALLVMRSMNMEADGIPLELAPDTAHHLSVKALEEGYELATTGEDPFVCTRPLKRAYDPDRHFVLSFEYFCPQGINGIQLFYGSPFAESRSAQGPELLSSEGWTVYSLNIKTRQEPGSWRGGYSVFRLDFGRQAGRALQLRNIRLRAPTPEELKQAQGASSRKESVAAFDAALRAMVDADYDSRIERVTATGESLRIEVALSDAREDLQLCEVPFYESPVERNTFVWSLPLPSRTGKQALAIERWREGHDRVFSSWILMRKTTGGLTPASHPHFVDDIPSQWRLTRDRPLSRKGTVGLNPGNTLLIDDYKALGIHNATKNIVLPALVKAKPGDDTLPHDFNGTTVHIDQNALQNLDESIATMTGLKIVVSAIILIPRGNPMAHPGCTPQGIYAMANVVEPDGWTLYAAGLDFLAQRYTRPDRKYGRITHWILHNEVDAGWIWTNAGELPMATYLDLYYRSMRTAQSAIRRCGSAGQVLISLTHYWTARHNSRCYPPRAMLDLLAKRSSREGDFDWGLAYHPYPQNLRDPRTWLDKEALFNFDTPLITPKNLEVLDAYMRQPTFLHDGKVRTVVLSEQGSNSPDHSEESYRNQAAGLVYTWLKFQELDSIEAYIHHRWMDHPKEGGLNLGLRKRSDAPDPEASKKLAWEIYRQLGTEAQSKAVEWSKTVIPEVYFENIPARVNR